MRRASNVDDFWRAPLGAYVVGRAHVQFCAADDLWGYVLWGALSELDVRAIAASVLHEAWASAPPHRSLIDLRSVTAIDPSAFVALRASHVEHGLELARRVTRMALVRPDGFIGAIAEGIRNVVAFPHPVDVVPTTEAALERLAVTDTALVAELEAVRATIPARVVTELHALFAAQPPDLALPAAAKLLGTSPRNLQRKLGDAGTNYLAERNIAQVRLAERMMLETDATLSQIALDVGCGSLQHFSTLFRRITGQTPSRWRDEHRGVHS